MTGTPVALYDFPLSICCQMARLALVEKGVPFAVVHVDISAKKQQFEAWYLALNPKAVVPTLKIADAVTTDTIQIVQVVDAAFDGPALTPTDDAGAEEMRSWLRDLMAPRFGVLLYQGMRGEDGSAHVIEGRKDMLLALRLAQPHAADVLDARIAGNAKLRATLSDPAAIAQVVDSMHALVRRIDSALGERSFLVGSAYSLADAFCTAVLARFDMHGHASWWQDGELPAAEAYYQRMQRRDSWKRAGIVNTHPGKI